MNIRFKKQNSKQTAFFYYLPLAFVSAFICMSKPILAQENAENGAQEDKKIEKIQVTGSRIKRIDIEGASPVTVYSKEDIARTGQLSVADFLRSSSASADLSTENATLSQIGGASAFSGRGFGPSYTLVLLNGRRLPVNAIGADFVDLNLVPLAAIERIEYLSDGASAIYGADAVAGVLNIVTKKDYNGSSVTYQTGQTDDGHGFEQGYQIVTGSSTNKTNVLITYDYFKREPIAAANRPLIKSAIAPDGTDGRSPTGIPGRVIRADGSSEAWKSCQKPEPLGSAGKTCYYDFGPLYQVQPFSERQSVFGFFDHELNDSLNLFGEINFSRSIAKTANGAAPGGVALSKDAPTNPYGEDITVVRRYLDFGPRRTDYTNNILSTTVGLKGILGANDWEITMGRAYVRNSQVGAGGQVNGDAASEYFNSGVLDPFTINTFDTDEKKEARDEIDTATFREGTTVLKTIDANISGPTPVELPGGSLNYAAGISARQEKFKDRSDALSSAGKILGSAGSNGGGKREGKAAFVELNAPIISALELNLASRYDDLGSTGKKGTYKASTAIRPINPILIRASYGTGFKAPDLHDLYLGESFGVTRAIDTKLCDVAKDIGDEEQIKANCDSPIEINSTSGGNPDLKPEKSQSLTAGLVVQAMEELSLSLDFWSISVKDQIGSLSTQELLNNEKQYGEFIKRDANGGLQGNDAVVIATLQNLAKAEGKGLELGLRYGIKTAIGDIDADLNLSKSISAKRQTSAVQPLCELVKYASPVDGKVGTSWTNGVLSASIKADYWGGYKTIDGGFEDGTCTPNQPETEYKVKSNTQLHLQAGYSASWGTKLTLGVNNVTDEKPAYDPYVSGGWPWYDQGRYRNAGRFLYAKLSQDF
ncbi:MAG: TonB-dependent receptor [Bdellovibrionota bacterium]